MSFSFFNPWLWLGAVSLAAPLWLHLRRRQENNLLRFAALRFLEDEPQPRQSPLRLRNPLLFLLRAVALLLIVAAFAIPYLKKRQAVAIEESRVYILDNTLSHQANGGFARDRERLIKELRDAGPSLQLAVIELTGDPRTLANFGDSRDDAIQRIEGLKPSFQRGSYLAAFRQANTLLTRSLGLKKKIVLLGDNQKNQWTEQVSSPPFLNNVAVELPTSTKTMQPNLWLSEPRVQRVFLGEKSVVNFSAKLGHAGPARSASIVLRANGREIFNRALELDKTPPSILLQAQWETEGTSWERGDITVEGTPDTLGADNHLYFSLPPVLEGQVALLSHSSYLKVALSRDIMRGRWATRMLEPSRLTEEIQANRDADVMVVESSFLQSAEARKLFWRYLSNGRGGILLVDRVTPAIKGFLRELGFEADAAPQAPPIKFQFVLFNHPVFHPFLSPEYGNLLDIKLYQHVSLKSSQASPLIFSDQGEPLFFESTRSNGKLFVAAFGFDRSQSSWPIHQTFVPFLDLALQAARGEDASPLTFEPGQVSITQLRPEATAREAVLRDSQGGVVARAAVEKGRIRLPMPAVPGLYEVTLDDSKEVEKVFSVNPSPKESELAYIATPDALPLWQVKDRAQVKGAPEIEAGLVSRAGILQQQWWWWMMLAGLAVLSLETILAQLTGVKATR